MSGKAGMSRFEAGLANRILRGRDVLFFICLLCLGILIRRSGKDMIAGDMEVCLIPWFRFYTEHGFSGLAEQVGDYNLLYQTLIALMAQIAAVLPIGCVHLYKLVSGVFDLALALSGARLICDLRGEKPFGMRFNLAFGVIFLLPTVVLNSGFWGQCDSAWTLMCVLTLHALYRERYGRAFALLGLAFAFKFQAIFLVPFVICHYFKKRDYSILLLLVSVLVFWASGAAAYLCGRDLLAPFRIYAAQTQTWPQMYLNFHSAWMLVGKDYAQLSTYAILTTFCVCGAGLYWALQDSFRLDSGEAYLVCAAWFVWTCVLFLPAMHERYTYLLDLLLVLLALQNRKYLLWASGSVILSTITYGNYLFQNGKVTVWGALAFLILWITFSVRCFGTLAQKQTA